MSALEVRGLRKSFGSLVVTDNVNLDLVAGERHALIGPNGAGKTSLVHQLAGQLAPDAGSIRLDGHKIDGLPPERICRLGLARAFQRNTLFRDLSAHENVRLAVQSRHGPRWNPFVRISDHHELADLAEASLARVGLAGRAAVAVRALSYGECRQLEIAIALACEPKVLLLDEPTSGISPTETRQIADLIASLPASIAILLVEHDMDVVFAIADRITVLHRGAVLASGTPAQITADPAVREVYLGGRRT